MTLPTYAMNQASFPGMYERFIVGPLFRPWVDELLDRAGVAAASACSTSPAARESWRGSRPTASARGGASSAST